MSRKSTITVEQLRNEGFPGQGVGAYVYEVLKLQNRIGPAIGDRLSENELRGMIEDAMITVNIVPPQS